MDRKNYIGSSDAASLWGVSPYKSYYTLYKEKFEGFVPEVNEELTKWGSRLEASIARGFAEDYGLLLEWSGSIESPDIPKTACTPDYYVNAVSADTPSEIKSLYERHGRGLLDVKNVDAFAYRGKWDNAEATHYIEIQMQHQMMVTGLKWAVVAALIGGNTPRLLVKERNQDFIDLHIAKIHEFWALTKAPEPDQHQSTIDTIKALGNVVTEEKEIALDDLPTTELALDIIELQRELKGLNTSLRAANAELDYKKALLIEKIGDASIAKLGDNIVVKSKLIQRKGYTVADSEYRQTSIKREGDNE